MTRPSTCSVLLSFRLLQVVEVCVSLLQKPQARLRWAALNCLCSFLQEETREEGAVVTPKEIQLLTCFMEALQTETVHRCRRKALQAIAEFFSNFAGDGNDSKEMHKEVFAQVAITTSESVTS